ncbi:hypothetical protein A8B78_21125 [Jannaschia sp. EhC01]|nr:hypothetical protein A8B78_21125 [Jannaschia sp. EhC01]
MHISDDVLSAVADILLEQGDVESSDSLQTFNNFIMALSADSGLPEQEIQSRLVERLLKDPGNSVLHSNVVRLDDYLHLLQVN